MIYFILLHFINVILVNEWKASFIPRQCALTAQVQIDAVVSYFYLIDFIEAHV
jgi:hypothetical protein